MDGTAHNKMVAAFSHTTKMAGAAGGGLGKALGKDSDGKGKGGGAKPERGAGVTIGPREPEVDDPAGKKDEAKGKPGQEAMGDEGSLRSARRAAKATEGGPAGARGDAAPTAREADVQNEKPQGGGTSAGASQSPTEKLPGHERVAQVTERPVMERKLTLAEDLEAFQAALDREDQQRRMESDGEQWKVQDDPK